MEKEKRFAAEAEAKAMNEKARETAESGHVYYWTILLEDHALDMIESNSVLDASILTFM